MDTLNAFISAMIAISIASERLVAILKSLIPWLAQETVMATGAVDLPSDRWRRVLVFVLAFVTSWVTASFLADSGFSMCGTVKMPGGLALPAVLIGLLGTGGSAVWSSFLNYTSALKDIKIQARDQTEGGGTLNRAMVAAGGAARTKRTTIA